MADREQHELDEEIEDFRRRVAELESARSLPAEERARILDTTLFELRHAADQLWPRLRDLTARERPKAGGGRQEERLLRVLFQRLPLPVALLDREAVVRRLNDSAARLVAAGPGYATGRPLTGFLALADRAAFRAQVAAVARGDGDRSLAVRLLPASQTLHVTLVALRPPGEPRSSVLAVVQAPGHAAPPGAPGAAAARAAGPAAAERGAELLDVLDEVAAALLSARGAGPEAPLRAVAAALARCCADLVVADLVGPDGAMRRVAVCGAPEGGADCPGSAAIPDVPGTDGPGPGGGRDEADDLAAQDPARCPIVAAAATSGVVAVRVRPDDVECLGRDRTGAAMIARLGVTSLVCLPVCATAGDAPVPAVLTLLRTAKGGRPGFTMAEAGVLDRAARLTALTLPTPTQ